MEFANLGAMDYQEALEYQMEQVRQVSDGGPDRVLFCSHPPVVTLGRAFKNKSQEVEGWQGEVVETNRGGKATYHGPSQLVVYPIIDLNKTRVGCRSRDIHDYLRSLEKTVVHGLKRMGVEAYTMETPKGSDQQFTGVWSGDKKVASIGVGVKKWVTYHGCAINVHKDSTAFQGIQPCGFNQSTMTSLEEILDKPIDKSCLLKILEEEMKKEFSIN